VGEEAVSALEKHTAWIIELIEQRKVIERLAKGWAVEAAKMLKEELRRPSRLREMFVVEELPRRRPKS